MLSGGRKIDQHHLYMCFLNLFWSEVDNYLDAVKILLSDGRELSQKYLYIAAEYLFTKKNYEELFEFLSLDKITLPEDKQKNILFDLDQFKELRPQFLTVLLTRLSDGLSDSENLLYIVIIKLIDILKKATSPEIKNNYRENIKLLLDYGSRLMLSNRGTLAIKFASIGEVDILQKLLNSGPITEKAKNKAIKKACFNKEAIIEVLQKATISDPK